MSGSPNASRSSTSSRPSAASSSTLGSRYPSYNIENGEALSFAGRESGRVLGGRQGMPEPDREHSPSSGVLGDDLVAEHDFAVRRHRPRRSGGFLLEPTLAPIVADDIAVRKPRRQEEDRKGKRKAEDPGASQDSKRSTPYHSAEYTADGANVAARNRTITVANHDDRTAEDPLEENHSRRDEHDTPRVSSEISASSSRTPDRLSPASASDRPASAGGGIDPAQIVNMALNLSESRRRHLSAGYLAAPPVTSSRRVTSAGLPLGTSIPHLQGGYQDHGVGGSLKAHLQQQRRISRNISPFAGRGSPRSRHASRSIPLSMEQSAVLPNPDYGYKFSVATLARAEKARTAIELSVEFRRLLQYLPPLKPDSTAPGNYKMDASSVPGSAAVHLYQVPSHTGDRHKLGRSYNPLQFLRNRRLRARVSRPLDPDEEEFNNTARVREWVDTVEKLSRLDGYREEDRVNLPEYVDSLSAVGGRLQSDIGHCRQGTASSKIKRPRMDWHIMPAGLLADAVWMEQDDNKSLIENRYSSLIFPHLQPRQSKESAREPEFRRHSTVESVASTNRSDPRTADNSDDENHRGRKRRHLLPVLGDTSITRALRVSRTRSGSPSGLSSSEDDDSSGRRTRRLRQAPDTDDENTGPLEKHLNDILTNQPNEAELSSPSVKSPDTPDKWGRGYASFSGDRINLNKKDSIDFASDTGSQQAASVIANSGKPATNGRPKESRPSFDGPDSAAPNAPAANKLLANITPDASPPGSRRPSQTRKSHKSKLSIFRSNAGNKDQNLSSTDAIAPKHNDQDSSPALSAEAEEKGRRSIDKPSPAEKFKNNLAHRRNESSSSLKRIESRLAKDARARKEPGSAVSRFFKGGRIGEIVRSETAKVGGFIWRKEPSGDDQRSVKSFSDASDLSETDDEALDAPGMKQRPKAHKRTAIRDNTTAAEQKYHRTNLPSFKPVSAAQDKEPRTKADNAGDDPVHRQQLEQRERTRSSRFNRLAPPRIDISAASTPNLSRQNTEDRRFSYASSQTDHLSVVRPKPGGVGLDGASSDLKADRHRSSSRPSASNKRHWSISDREHQQQPSTKDSKATLTTDLARTRALLLATGIKARTIHLCAYEPRDKPPDFLRQAASAAQATLLAVPRKEEHVLAAKILSTAIEASAQSLQTSSDVFRSRASDLHAALSDLRETCEEELTPRVRDCADEADAVTKRLTHEMPLAVKEVHDSIEGMLRVRRRRMRWVRRAGWVLLEWAVLGVMWGVWAVVVVVNFVVAVVKAPYRAVRWALWL